ncbi:MAG: hypothetical protein IID46_15625 [Planctomycetes bacterium]|nr:hypothetical protein [Planctomycetota bacterium]
MSKAFMTISLLGKKLQTSYETQLNGYSNDSRSEGAQQDLKAISMQTPTAMIALHNQPRLKPLRPAGFTIAPAGSISRLVEEISEISRSIQQSAPSQKTS